MKDLNQINKSLQLQLLYLLLLLAIPSIAQSPTPTPSQSSGWGGYEVTSTFELGGRWVEVSGNENKFKSDFNYKDGIRVFDSSFLVENSSGDRNAFDSALVMWSGWGGDPNGMFRMNFEKAGTYKFDSNIRRVKYFNSLNNHALNLHNADTQHDFGDFDLTIFPESQKLRFNVGYSYNRTDGPAAITTRAYSDEYGVKTEVDNGSDDFRAGLDTQLAGINLGFGYGHRSFRENTFYFIDAVNPGLNLTNTSVLNSFQRNLPIEGSTDFGTFRLQRTFAQRFDVSARLIYSLTKTNFRMFEHITGRDNSNNIVDQDQFTISGDSKRPQTRGDIGLTYRITKKFRISDTFTYDQFNIAGGSNFFEDFRRRNAAGVILSPTLTATLYHRVTGYSRTSNLIEGDYQFSPRFGFNVGYRYTFRDVVLDGFDRNLFTLTDTLHPDESENHTNTLIIGANGKPTKNWVIYADAEIGEADNVFTRLANYDYVNFRIRNRVNYKNLVFNASFISKDNDNPSQSSVTGPPSDFTAETRSRIFTTSIDWAPNTNFNFSTGYTYNHLTAETDIIVPLANSVLTPGVSQYFVRNSYFFFDVSAKPFSRLSLFASYRIDDDRGQGDRVSTAPQDIITGYPMTMHMPEIRLAWKLNKYLDWNFGYQYYDYKEDFPNAQNYHAHMPYTSLRIYFGKSAADR
ncbi:MAG TPA: hypothetical protein VL572_03230 [Pyrinomonadaceae bacterium]|nr:hypothetical protein [Pyrinomonadaceae bacterium]